MEKQFWNNRYAENETVYGYEPNLYFKKFIDTHKPGSILLPAEGEGRNAIYAALKGWQVDAFDFSETAMKKALAQAAIKNVNINYWVQDVSDYKANKLYEAVALIYVHLPSQIRKHFHNQIYESIKSEGFLVLEAFAKEQLQFESGGPRDARLLYDAPAICSDFPFLHLLSCGQKEIILNEGDFHNGRAAVLQLTGQKL